jgi:hypothetical protein
MTEEDRDRSSDSTRESDDQEHGTVEVHYVKKGDYRTVYADGAIGGLTPKGNLFFDLYSERGATPDRVVHKLDPEGTSLGPAVEADGKKGLVRHAECGVIMDINAVLQLHRWLEEKIREFEKTREVEILGGENDIRSEQEDS